MTIGFGIIGLGTIGTGVFKLWQEQRDLIHRKSHCNLRLCEVADIRPPTGLELADVQFSPDAHKTIENPDINIIIELVGGTGIALEIVQNALRNGKSVVTANKALIAKHGDELHELADKHSAYLMYEASVCGGIPLLDTIQRGLVANRIDSITGTVNGTCNYILSKMLNERADFAEVLKSAQDLGFAEADPSFDIDGIDAAHKITILAALGFGVRFEFNKCYARGITDIHALDLQFANALDYRLMHLAHAQNQAGQIKLGVFPALVRKNHILSDVFLEMNAVVVQASGTGATLYYGAGAGAFPTASAVLSDVVDIANRLRNNTPMESRWCEQTASSADTSVVTNFDHGSCHWYVRINLPQEGIDPIITAIENGSLATVKPVYFSLPSGQPSDLPQEAGENLACALITKAMTKPELEKLLEQILTSAHTDQSVYYPVMEIAQ